MAGRGGLNSARTGCKGPLSNRGPPWGDSPNLKTEENRNEIDLVNEIKESRKVRKRFFGVIKK